MEKLVAWKVVRMVSGKQRVCVGCGGPTTEIGGDLMSRKPLSRRPLTPIMELNLKLIRRCFENNAAPNGYPVGLGKHYDPTGRGPLPLHINEARALERRGYFKITWEGPDRGHIFKKDFRPEGPTILDHIVEATE